MEEKKNEGIAKQQRKRATAIAIACLCLIGTGVALVLVGAMHTSVYPADFDHITDKSLAVRDIENATYTWTAEEIDEQADKGLAIMIIGGLFAAAGYPLLFVVPRETELHKMYCEIEEYGPCKYCPECGLKLSRLEKK